MEKRHLHLVTDNSVEYDYEFEDNEPDWVYVPTSRYNLSHPSNVIRLVRNGS